MQQLEALRHPIDMQLTNYALYESVLGKMQSPNGLSHTMASTIRVKQECTLSPLPLVSI